VRRARHAVSTTRVRGDTSARHSRSKVAAWSSHAGASATTPRHSGLSAISTTVGAPGRTAKRPLPAKVHAWRATAASGARSASAAGRRFSSAWAGPGMRRASR
jgi:hypothetical protein